MVFNSQAMQEAVLTSHLHRAFLSCPEVSGKQGQQFFMKHSPGALSSLREHDRAFSETDEKKHPGDQIPMVIQVPPALLPDASGSTAPTANKALSTSQAFQLLSNH